MRLEPSSHTRNVEGEMRSGTGNLGLYIEDERVSSVPGSSCAMFPIASTPTSTFYLVQVRTMGSGSFSTCSNAGPRKANASISHIWAAANLRQPSA